jgi:hypothetical protein
MEFTSHNYYNNTSIDQDCYIMMQFKSGSHDTQAFKGNAQAYRIGKAVNPQIIRIVQETLNPDRYLFFAFMGHSATEVLLQ